ncbi:MAG TPA: N-acetylmuramoyl-L-alanine amidase [Waddliaceae bacterium]
MIEEVSPPLPQRIVTPPKPPFRKSLIVIDAGHGGQDLGTQSLLEPKTQEKHLTLTTSLMLNQYLKNLGYQTILTRAEDFFVPLDLRSAFANSNKASLFVSVHYNSAPSTQAEGVEVYYYQSDKDKTRSDKSKQLAEKVLNRVITNTKAKSRGVKHGNFAVIRETKMPAILVEGGFVTNDRELRNLRNLEYLKKIAESIAQGINDYLK